MIISWFFFFYLLLSLPVLVVSWYFSEPFWLMLSQDLAVMGLCVMLLVFLLQYYFRQRLFAIESNQYVIVVMLWLGAAILGASIFKVDVVSANVVTVHWWAGNYIDGNDCPNYRRIFGWSWGQIGLAWSSREL
jgi:hypothetical protein